MADRSEGRPWPERLLAAFLLLVVLAVAAGERLGEPSSSRVVVAEDPLTHIVFTKEHVGNGYFGDSFHLGTVLYPPGLHAWLGSLHMLAGVELYPAAIWLAPMLGILAVATTFLFAWRTAGPAAAFVSGYLVAILPEVIFRSELFSPTVLDLALLPILLLTVAEALDGRPAVLVGSAVVGSALALSHPWIVSIAAAAGLGVLVLHRFLPPATAGPDAPRARFAAAAVLTGLTALGWLVQVGQDADKGVAGTNALLVGGALLLTGLALFDWRSGRGVPPAAPRRRVVPALAGGAALAAVAVVVLRAVGSEPGTVNVNYAHMLGPAAAAAAVAGFAVLFVARAQLGYWGAALVAVVFPFTAADLLNLWYLPHRSVAFLGLGAALLGGAAAQTAVEAVRAGAARFRPAASKWAAAAATVAVLLAATPLAAAHTPDRPYTWYRLFNDEEFRCLEWAAERTMEGGAPRVMTYSWQSNAFLKALGNPPQVVYDQGFYRGEMRGFWQERTMPGHLYAVVDAYVKGEVGDPFANQPDFSRVQQCGGVSVYRWGGG